MIARTSVGVRQRCEWATDPLYWDYHDKEWGAPVHDDQRLFELIVLEGAQAGLSWSTIQARAAIARAGPPSLKS